MATNNSIKAAFERLWQHITNALSNKADVSHTHNDQYYTESEVDTMLAGKADTSHGEHITTPQHPSKKAFLRDDNTWAAITPANIGAATSTHTHKASDIGAATSTHTHKASDITSGIIPIANGGTGANNPVVALDNLGIYAPATKLNYTRNVTSDIQTQLDGKAPTTHTHTVSNITDLTATATELNYVDGVTSNIQTQLDGKASTNHKHTYAGSSSIGGAANSANKVNITRPSNVLTAAGNMAVFTEEIYFLGSDGLANGAPVNYCIINAKKGANYGTILDCYALQTGDHYINGCMYADNDANGETDEWTGWILQPNPTTISNLETTISNTYETKTNASNKLTEAKAYTDTKTSSLASTSSVTTNINTHNTSTAAHNDIRVLINDLTTKLNNFLDVDDTTTDQLSEVITLIENNKGTLESLTTTKINVSDIINNLTTNSSSKVLSAAQGVVIKQLIDDLETYIDDCLSSIPEYELTTSPADNYIVSSGDPLFSLTGSKVIELTKNPSILASEPEDEFSYTFSTFGGIKIGNSIYALEYDCLDNRPAHLSNPEFLTINGVTYDGSEPVSITVATTEDINTLYGSDTTGQSIRDIAMSVLEEELLGGSW